MNRFGMKKIIIAILIVAVVLGGVTYVYVSNSIKNENAKKVEELKKQKEAAEEKAKADAKAAAEAKAAADAKAEADAKAAQEAKAVADVKATADAKAKAAAEAKAAEDAKYKRTEDKVYIKMHEMINGKIVAKDGLIWNVQDMSQDNFNDLVTKINYNNYPDKDVLLAYIDSWKKGDFSNAVDQHNYIWEKLGGKDGKAIGLKK